MILFHLRPCLAKLPFIWCWRRVLVFFNFCEICVSCVIFPLFCVHLSWLLGVFIVLTWERLLGTLFRESLSWPFVVADTWGLCSPLTRPTLVSLWLCTQKHFFAVLKNDRRELRISRKVMRPMDSGAQLSQAYHSGSSTVPTVWKCLWASRPVHFIENN